MKITLYTGKYGKELIELGEGAFACLFPDRDLIHSFSVDKDRIKFMGNTKDNMLYYVKGDVEFDE